MPFSQKSTKSFQKSLFLYIFTGKVGSLLKRKQPIRSVSGTPSGPNSPLGVNSSSQLTISAGPAATVAAAVKIPPPSRDSLQTTRWAMALFCAKKGRANSVFGGGLGKLTFFALKLFFCRRNTFFFPQKYLFRAYASENDFKSEWKICFDWI